MEYIFLEKYVGNIRAMRRVSFCRINSIRHSPSDPALNRPNTAQSRSTSLNRNFATSTALSARNPSTTASSSSTRKPNKAQVPPNPKLDVRVSQIRNSVEDTEKEELVPMSADKPYGLDVENFLPVSLSTRYTMAICNLKKYLSRRTLSTASHRIRS